MKKFLLGTLVMVAGLFALASEARAQTNGAVTVHINQDFIAGVGAGFSGIAMAAKLRRAGNVYYLSEVVTDLGVYTFPAPHVLTQTAKKTAPGKMAASGSNRAESGPATE